MDFHHEQEETGAKSKVTGKQKAPARESSVETIAGGDKSDVEVEADEESLREKVARIDEACKDDQAAGSSGVRRSEEPEAAPHPKSPAAAGKTAASRYHFLKTLSQEPQYTALLNMLKHVNVSARRSPLCL